MIETSLHQSEPVALPGRPFGTVARSIAGHALLTALMIVTPMLPVFVPAALLHCGLRNGRRAAWMAAAVAMTLVALYAASLSAPDAEAVRLGRVSFAAIGLAIVLPSLLVLPLVERAAKFGQVLALLLVGSVAGLAATELLSRAVLSYSAYGSFVAAMEQSNARAIATYRSHGVPAEMLRSMEQWGTFLLPAFVLMMFAVVFVLSLLMLGRLKAWHDLAARRGDGEALGVYLFRNLSLPDWLLFAFVAGGLTPLATGLLQKVAANTLAVVAFLYILQGLAIFRFLLAAMGAGFAGTVLGLLLLTVLTFTGVAPLLLGVAGLFDSFFDFRHFKKRKDDSHESHSD